jgi:hypothetical protein
MDEQVFREEYYRHVISPLKSMEEQLSSRKKVQG